MQIKTKYQLRALYKFLYEHLLFIKEGRCIKQIILQKEMDIEEMVNRRKKKGKIALLPIWFVPVWMFRDFCKQNVDDLYSYKRACFVWARDVTSLKAAFMRIKEMFYLYRKKNEYYWGFVSWKKGLVGFATIAVNKDKKSALARVIMSRNVTGVGDILVVNDLAEKSLKRKGVKRIEAYIHEENRLSKRFVLRLGYLDQQIPVTATDHDTGETGVFGFYVKEL